MSFTLKQLRVFSEIAKHQNYTHAAKALYLSQPAVSMQMKNMEDLAGLPLFERLGKIVTLTEAGKELLNYAENIQQQLNEAESVLEDLKGLKRGKLHLTMASTANYFAPQLIAAFKRQYPYVKITLDVSNRSGLVHAVEHNLTDMAIMGQPPKGHHLLGISFMSNPLVVIAAPSHPLATRSTIPLHEVADEPFIVREPDSGTRMAAERFFAHHNLELIAGMEMNRSEALKQAVMAELGLGIVSLHTIEMELTLKRLVVLHVEDFPIMRHWYIVYREGKRFAAIPEAFKDFSIEQAESLISLPEISQLIS
ncbi:MAG: LysR family transcriptional regulator [Mariprofundaceae bacterium]|nr:LysR family transcriptional regulator [Mariprofundaceae bacterium]